MMENVKALMSKKFMPEFNKWREYLESLQYESFTKIINATQCGIPQNRERVFMISILRENEEDIPVFRFPDPIPLEKKLKDVLEPAVDDKYVLSEKSIEGFLQHNENHEEKGTGFIWRPKDVENNTGGRLLIASERMEHSVRQIIPSEKPDIANCLRAKGTLNATDNSLIVYEETSDTHESNAWRIVPNSQGAVSAEFVSELYSWGGYGATGVIEIVYEDNREIQFSDII